jgi:hypothetical protein
MKRINSYKELQEEKQRTREKIDELENIISQDINSWKVTNIVESLFTSQKKNGLLSESINQTMESLAKGVLLRRFSWPVRFLGSYLLKNLARNMYASNSTTMYEWVKDKILSIRKSPRSSRFSEAESNF